jgi:hypothetical protein
MTSVQSEARGLTLRELAWLIVPTLCERERERNEAAALLKHYLAEHPRKAVRLCLNSPRARKALVKCIENARRFAVATGSASSSSRCLSRREVLTAAQGVQRDLRDEVTRTGLRIVDALCHELTNSGGVVMATGPMGIRRELVRAELLRVGIDFHNNQMTLDDIAWKDVQVLQMTPNGMSSGSSQPEPSSLDKVLAHLNVWAAELIERQEETCQREFDDQVPFKPGTTRRVIAEKERRKLFNEMIPEQLRARRGTGLSVRRRKMIGE